MCSQVYTAEFNFDNRVLGFVAPQLCSFSVSRFFDFDFMVLRFAVSGLPVGFHGLYELNMKRASHKRSKRKRAV